MRPRRLLGLAGPALLVALCSAAPAAADPATPAIPLPDPVAACPSPAPATAGLGPLAAVGRLPVLSPALNAVGRAVDPRCGLVAGALGHPAAPPASAAAAAAERRTTAEPAVGGLDADLPVRLYSFTGDSDRQDLPAAAVPGQFAPAPNARYGGVPGPAGAPAAPAALAGGPVQDAGQATALGGGAGGIGLPLLAAVLALSGASAALVRTVALRRLP